MCVRCMLDHSACSTPDALYLCADAATLQGHHPPLHRQPPRVRVVLSSPGSSTPLVVSRPQATLVVQAPHSCTQRSTTARTWTPVAKALRGRCRVSRDSASPCAQTTLRVFEVRGCPGSLTSPGQWVLRTSRSPVRSAIRRQPPTQPHAPDRCFRTCPMPTGGQLRAQSVQQRGAGCCVRGEWTCWIKDASAKDGKQVFTGGGNHPDPLWENRFSC